MTATLQLGSRLALQGDSLLDFVHTNATTMSNSEMCDKAGYPSQDAFRDALTAARLFRGEYKDANGIPTFDVDLLEQLHSLLNISQSECVELAITLRDDYGINDDCDFNDVYAYSSEEYNWESEFAEYWAREVCCFDGDNEAGMNPWIVIDWQATWDCNLRYDFSVIEYSDGVLILHNN